MLHAHVEASRKTQSTEEIATLLMQFSAFLNLAVTESENPSLTTGSELPPSDEETLALALSGATSKAARRGRVKTGQ